MKALITGGAGFIGLHLARLLLKKNFKIDLLDNFSIGLLDEELSKLLKHPNIKLIEKDLSNVNSYKMVDNDYDFIFHFAAILGVENVINSPYEVLDRNVILTLNALNIAKRQKSLKSFTFSSTSEVYAGTLENNLLKIPTKENSVIVLPELVKPRTSYLLSKVYGEALCVQSNIPSIIIRPNNIYGPRMGMSHVIPQLLKKSFLQEKNGFLEVHSLKHTRTFCYVDDAVKQIYLLAKKKEAINSVFNIGSQKPEITINKLALKIIKLLNKKLKIKSLPNTEGSVSRRCPNMEKTTKFTHYKNQISIDEGLILTYEWYLKNYF